MINKRPAINYKGISVNALYKEKERLERLIVNVKNNPRMATKMKRSKINRTKKQISSINDILIKTDECKVVSEHAIVRYLERVHGLNSEDVRQKIESSIPEGREDGRYEIDGGGVAIVKNKRVITVVIESGEEW